MRGWHVLMVNGGERISLQAGSARDVGCGGAEEEFACKQDTERVSLGMTAMWQG